MNDKDFYFMRANQWQKRVALNAGRYPMRTGNEYNVFDEDDNEQKNKKLADNQLNSNGKIITLNEGQMEAVRIGEAFLSSNPPSRPIVDFDIELPSKYEKGSDIEAEEVQFEEVPSSLPAKIKKPEDYMFMTVFGSAGSGKTTVVKAILMKLGGRSVVVTAPTHKAKKVVSKSTGYRGETIHKIVGLKPNVELEGFKPDNVLFDLLGKNLMDEYDTLVIDEAGMLNTALKDLIKQKAKEKGMKVIFLGDVRQLPPVGEAIGSIFVDEEILQVKLSKVERQQVGNPLIELYDIILSHIDVVDILQQKMDVHNSICKLGAKATKFQKELLIHPMELGEINNQLNRIPYECISNVNDEYGYEFFSMPQDFGERMLQGFFKFGEDTNNRILCFSNDEATKWNNYIRKKVIGTYLSPLVPGELLMAYKTVTNPDDWRDTWYENSNDYIVTKVDKGYKPAATYDESIKADINGYYVVIKPIDGSDFHEKTLFFVDRASYFDFWKIESNYLNFALNATNNKKWAWKNYYDFRNRFALLGGIKWRDLGIDKDKDAVSKDFDFAYAITIHKSQGSTYNNVFVVADDILKRDVISAPMKYRLLYVALSRPTNKAFILQTK